MPQNGSSDRDSLKSGPRSAERGGLSRILRSFVFAGRGIAHLVITETNARIHLLVSVMVVGLGLGLGVSRSDWCFLWLAMGLVWGLEGINTALERLADALHPQDHPLIRQCKDAAAGAVLLGAIAAAMVGLTIFLPLLFEVTQRLLGGSP